MKKAGVFVLMILILFSTVGCILETRQDPVLDSLGKYDTKQFWTHGGFQDYTDFGIYTYSSVSLVDNPYFSLVTEEDRETLEGFLDDFENWIEVFRDGDPRDELVLHYAFDRSIIDSEDYFYIYAEYGWVTYNCYDVWILDTQSNRLYYFHNNI